MRGERFHTPEIGESHSSVEITPLPPQHNCSEVTPIEPKLEVGEQGSGSGSIDNGVIIPETTAQPETNSADLAVVEKAISEAPATVEELLQLQQVLGEQMNEGMSE